MPTGTPIVVECDENAGPGDICYELTLTHTAPEGMCAPSPVVIHYTVECKPCQPPEVAVAPSTCDNGLPEITIEADPDDPALTLCMIGETPVTTTWCNIVSAGWEEVEREGATGVGAPQWVLDQGVRFEKVTWQYIIEYEDNCVGETVESIVAGPAETITPASCFNDFPEQLDVDDCIDEMSLVEGIWVFDTESLCNKSIESRCWSDLSCDETCAMVLQVVEGIGVCYWNYDLMDPWYVLGDPTPPETITLEDLGLLDPEEVAPYITCALFPEENIIEERPHCQTIEEEYPVAE